MNPSIYAKPVIPRIVVRPALATLLLHGLLVFFMTANWASTERERIKAKPMPNLVNARLVDVSDLQPKREAPKPPPKKEPPKPEPKKEPPKPEPPKPEPPKPVPPKPAAPAPTPKPAPKAAEPKPAPPPPAPAKPTQSQQSNRDALARIAQDELATISQPSSEVTATADEMSASFITLIQQTVVNYWSRPPSARNGMECELVVQLIPTGEVVSVTLVRSSGNAAFDSSAVNAVKKAGAFPELQKLPSSEFERKFRRLNLIFRPEDLRY